MDYEEYLEDWRKTGDYLKENMDRLVEIKVSEDEGNALRPMDEAVKNKLRNLPFTAEGKEPGELMDFLIDEVYPYKMHSSQRNFYGFIPATVSPFSVLSECVNSFMNPYGGSMMITPGITALEIDTINFLAKSIGYEVKQAGGNFVSGGSMGNLTAAIIARDSKLGCEHLAEGRVYISDQTHSSYVKALHVIGLTNAQIKIIPTDDAFEMRMDLLQEEVEKDIAAGARPFLLVANAGSTNTGSVDPLCEMADMAEKYNMWLHVDGAFGGSVLLSGHKELLKGIERADSVTWDAHKWLFQTYSCAAIIVKNYRYLESSFHANPEYLKDVDARENNLNLWDMGVELTRPSRGLKLWYTLKAMGMDKVQRCIDRGFLTAEKFCEKLRAEKDVEIISGPTLGVVNCRFVVEGMTEEELNAFNHRISELMVAAEKYLVLTTILKNKTVLRFCCINPKITEKDLDELLKTLLHFKEVALKEVELK